MNLEPSSRRRMWPVVAAVAAVLLVGVGVVIGVLLNRPAARVEVTMPNGANLDDVAASLAALPDCAALFSDGQTIDEAQAVNGCRMADGTVTLVMTQSCVDGRHLFTQDGRSGAPRGYGFGGGPFTAIDGELATDRGYAAAYNDCYGNS